LTDIDDFKEKGSEVMDIEMPEIITTNEILFEYDLFNRNFIFINKFGLDLLGFSNLDELNTVNFRELFFDGDIENIKSAIKVQCKTKSNDHCCFIRIKDDMNKSNKLFVKFYLRAHNNSKIVKGIAHALSDNIINSDIISSQNSQLLESKHLQLFNLLTKREKEILKLLCNGHKNSEIAELLSISIYTVQTHRKRVIKKLKVNNSMDLHKFKLCIV